MKLKAYAKINFSLRVFEKRPDGFHNIESVMQSVSLCDYVTLSLSSSGIEVACDNPKVPQGKDNLAYKAADIFLSSVTSHQSPVKGIKIHIEKRIPMASGLAGGSADAAAVLYGLNNMMTGNRRLETGDLLRLGAQVGADVPFCLTGGTCLVKGKGEIVEKQAPWPKTYYILVCPDIHISTKWAYEEFDRLHLNVSEEIKNDLEPIAVSRHEIIAEIKEKLLSLGCSETQMSGSGPSVFGAARHKAEAEDIFAKIKEGFPRCYLVETADQGLGLV